MFHRMFWIYFSGSDEIWRMDVMEDTLEARRLWKQNCWRGHSIHYILSFIHELRISQQYIVFEELQSTHVEMIHGEFVLPIDRGLALFISPPHGAYNVCP